MNQVQSNLKTDEQTSVVVAQGPDVTHSGPRIEPCDFEDLLERAMEILNARDLKAQLKTTKSTSVL